MQRKKKKIAQTGKPGAKKKSLYFTMLLRSSPECGVCGQKPSCQPKQVKSCHSRRSSGHKAAEQSICLDSRTGLLGRQNTNAQI